jgi:hypothetical protein
VVNQHLCSVHIVAAAEALSLRARWGSIRPSYFGYREGAAGRGCCQDRGPMVAGTEVR